MPKAGSEEPYEEFTEEPNTISKSKEDEDIEIAGCSFSIYPMNRGYIEMIRSALDKVDMSKVWSRTDDVSTVIRGRISHVFDVSKAVFFQAAETGEHVTLRATYSIGDPRSETGDAPEVKDDQVLNETSARISRPVSVKFALYPLGDQNYWEVINNQIEAIKEQDINVSVEHYETRLEGDAEKLFKGLEKVFRNTEMAGAHTVMTVVMVAHNIENR